MILVGIVGVAFLLIAVGLITYVVKAYAKKTTLGRYLGSTYLMVTMVLIFYALNLFGTDNMHMKMCACFEHFFTTWAVFFMTMFILELCGKSVPKIITNWVCIILCLDSAVLLTNPINQFAFGFTVRNGMYTTYMQIDPKPLYYIHCLLIIAMIIWLLTALIIKTISSPVYYKPRYIIIQIVIFLVVVTNSFFNFSNKSTIDISRFIYGLGALLFFYLTYDFQPRGLVRELREYVNDNISDAVILYDILGNVIERNEIVTQLFSYEEYSTKDNLLALIDEEIVIGKSIHKFDNKIFEINYNPFYDRENAYVASSFIFHDVTESMHRVEREHRVATIDALTGLHNRLGFLEAAPTFISMNNTHGAYAVMVSGICNFKGINSLYGTRAGDKVLKEIARIYGEYSKDIPMEYGRTAEGKFSCVIPFENVDTLINDLSRINLVLDSEVEITVDMCHGFVVMHDRTKTVEHYYELAVLALARCKQQMTSSALEYSQDMAEEQVRKQKLLSAMHDSVANREFYIELQPQIDLAKNKVVGAEALVRWNHPTLGRISPAEFIPLFESNGFVTKLDRYVWNEAAEILHRFNEVGLYDGSISINVSQIDIMCLDVVGELSKIVKKHEIPPEKLHIEITESACVNNQETLISTLNELRSMGFVIEIDDFGSGYSSLNALVHIPFDVVKLDMMFMARSASDEKGDVIMSAVSSMIHELDAEVIVEGIETIENVEMAVHLNADIAQGFYYSKSLTIEKFIDYVKNFGK